MSGVVTIVHEQEFTAQTSITVTHNLNLEFLDVVLLVGGERRIDLIKNVTPTLGNETNEFIIELISSQTGEIIVEQHDSVSITVPYAVKSGGGVINLPWTGDVVDKDNWVSVDKHLILATSGHVLPMDVHIRSLSINYSSVLVANRAIDLYLDESSQSFYTVPLDADDGVFTLVDLDIAIAAGVRIRMKATSATGKLNGFLINMIVEVD